MMPERAGRPLLLIDLAVPRDIDPACAELPGVTLSDIDDLQRQVARQQLVRRAEARKAEGIVEEEIQTFAGWLGSLEVMPTLAALRTRGDEVVDRLLDGERGPLGVALARRPRARRAARPHRRQAAAARAHAARPPARRRAPSCAPPAAARAVRPRRAGGGRAARGRRGPPAAAARRELTPLRVGTRGSALALVQARWVADRLEDAEIVEIVTSGDRARGRRRQVALGRRDRGGARRGRDRPRGALGQGRPGRAGRRAARSSRRRRGRARWTCWSSGRLRGGGVHGEPAGARTALRRSPACPKAPAWDQLAAPPGAAALGPARPRGRRAARATSTRGCASSTRARPTRIVLAAAGLERLGIARDATPLDFVPGPGPGHARARGAGGRRAGAGGGRR